MSDNEISSFLIMLLGILLVFLFVLFFIFIFLKIKISKNTKNKNSKEEIKVSSSTTPVRGKEYNKQFIFDFLEFDKIEDNMIVTKNGNKYIMAIECQGVNYDLMSGIEKSSVEQGFLQFLNTLRFPIQIYVQTRTVNLENGIIKYKEKIEEIKNRLVQKKFEYERLKAVGASVSQLNKVRMDYTREENLYEYGLDIVENTEKMSLNKNILRKHYYVVYSYMPEDINSSNLDKDEISSMAFSELYTRGHSMINALSVCGIQSKLLNSNELAKLLYIAYNRDDSELYDLDKALDRRYDRLYSTSEDVLDKRMRAIDNKISVEAEKMANDSVAEAMFEKEKLTKIKEKEKNKSELIAKMAKMILNDNESLIGNDLVEESKKIIERKNSKEKEEKK